MSLSLSVSLSSSESAVAKTSVLDNSGYFVENSYTLYQNHWLHPQFINVIVIDAIGVHGLRLALSCASNQRTRGSWIAASLGSTGLGGCERKLVSVCIWNQNRCASSTKLLRDGIEICSLGVGPFYLFFSVATIWN